MCVTLALTSLAKANVEKTIFLAPAPLTMPNDASIDNLYLIPLSPNHSSVRTRLNASFPSKSHPQGTETWMLLDGLLPGSRYEVRICWLATVCCRPEMLPLAISEALTVLSNLLHFHCTPTPCQTLLKHRHSCHPSLNLPMHNKLSSVERIKKKYLLGAFDHRPMMIRSSHRCSFCRYLPPLTISP